MVICSALGVGGRTILLLGLSAKNIERLQNGEPIRVSQETHGMAVPNDIVVLIVAGESEESIAKYLADNGLIGPSTIVNQDKPQ